jgi:hypothetical protein
MRNACVVQGADRCESRVARGRKTDARSSLAVLVLSLLTVALGVYMAILRPPLLPEDVRFLGVDPSTLAPSLLRWLSLVFATWGAFITAFGVVLFGVANALRTARTTVLRRATALALMIAFGRFLWFIVLVLLVSLASAIMLVVRSRRRAPGGC